MKHREKLENYLENYTRTKLFQDRVAKIRKRIGIPKDGIAFPKQKPMSFLEGDASMIAIKYKGKVYWPGSEQLGKEYDEIYSDLNPAFRKGFMWLFLNIYILHNMRHYKMLDDWDIGSVKLENLRIEYKEMEGRYDPDFNVAEIYLDNLSKDYPMAIGISPYATQNEVIDFVKKQWKKIEHEMSWLAEKHWIYLKEEDKSTLAKTRKRKSQARKIEDLIYENKDLSLQQLGKLVKERMGTSLDQAEVGKIKSLAIKRREEIGK